MIIFDMDGTLWDTVDSSYEAAKRVADKYDEVKDISRETIQKGMGSSRVENGFNFMPYLEPDKRDFYMGKINDEVMKVIEEKGANIYDGVVDTIKELSKEYKLGIITNNNDKYVELFINFAELNGFFVDYLGTSGRDMSKTDAIRLMCERNNEPHSYYVGDIKKDKLACSAAGQTFIHARYGFDPNLECEYHIDSFSELKDLIKKIP